MEVVAAQDSLGQVLPFSDAEFDLVINCDHFSDPRWCADLVARAYRRKFPTPAGD